MRHHSALPQGGDLTSAELIMCVCAGLGGRGDSGQAAADASDAVLTGPEFRQRVLLPDGSIDRREFDALWPALRVMGRCSPQDKHTIVRGAPRACNFLSGSEDNAKGCLTLLRVALLLSCHKNRKIWLFCSEHLGSTVGQNLVLLWDLKATAAPWCSLPDHRRQRIVSFGSLASQLLWHKTNIFTWGLRATVCEHPLY